MNILTHCTNCETTEGVRFQCKGCNFARFCSRDCLKKCWKKHKRFCMPLTDAVNNSIEIIRPFLKNKFRIDNPELHCMFCLEGGTSEDPLFHCGCGCRPDSGMSIGHIKCFQEFARASFADETKRENNFQCGLERCNHCNQKRNGLIFFEMHLMLWKLYDPDSLRRNIQGIDNMQNYLTDRALVCLQCALLQSNFLDIESVSSTYCRLRVIYLLKNIYKQKSSSDEKERLENEIPWDIDVGTILFQCEKYQATIDFNKQNYEKLFSFIPKYPGLKEYRSALAFGYAQSLLAGAKASLQSSNPHDPPYIMTAEYVMTKEMVEVALLTDDIVTFGSTVVLYAQICCFQSKFDMANTFLSMALQRVPPKLGPSHPLTKCLRELDAKIRSHLNQV